MKNQILLVLVITTLCGCAHKIIACRPTEFSIVRRGFPVTDVSMCVWDNGKVTLEAHNGK